MGPESSFGILIWKVGSFRNKLGITLPSGRGPRFRGWVPWWELIRVLVSWFQKWDHLGINLGSRCHQAVGPESSFGILISKVGSFRNKVGITLPSGRGPRFRGWVPWWELIRVLVSWFQKWDHLGINLGSRCHQAVGPESSFGILIWKVGSFRNKLGITLPSGRGPRFQGLGTLVGADSNFGILIWKVGSFRNKLGIGRMVYLHQIPYILLSDSKFGIPITFTFHFSGIKEE